MLSSYYCRKEDAFNCRYLSSITKFKYSISFILFSVRFNIKLLNHCSLATILVYAVSRSADVNASATKISDFYKFSVISKTFVSSSKSLSAKSLSLSLRILTFGSFLWGHLFAHCNFESHITHLEILPFLSTGFNLLTCLKLSVHF